MRAAVIAPTGLLKRYAARSTYHLCLAHLILENGTYAQFYREAVNRGEFVILDNSVIELEHPMSGTALLEAIDILNPTEFVMKDYPRDPASTHQWAVEMGPILKENHPDMKLMVVPQWKEDKVFMDWWQSMMFLRQLPFVDTIGLPKFIRSGRELACKQLDQRAELREGKEFHLLGTWGNPNEVRDLALRFKWIRGVDSKAPVRFGQHGIALHPELGLLGGHSLRDGIPALQFSNSSDPLPAITDHNVRTYLGWAKSIEPEAEVIPFPVNTGGFIH